VSQKTVTLQLIRDKGFEHEAAVLARLERLHGPAECIPPDASLAVNDWALGPMSRRGVLRHSLLSTLVVLASSGQSLCPGFKVAR
jgi:hypothetical protein